LSRFQYCIDLTHELSTDTLTRLHYPYARCVVWDLQTFQEFAKLSTKLTDGAFLFTGLELLESLSSKQLSTLLNHPWQSREKELETEVDEVEIQDGKQTRIHHYVGP
jgi:hypothetical protein